MSDLQRLKVKAAFDDFMQDMYDEEELQHIDSGFVNALWLAFYQAWCAAIESVVVDISAIDGVTDDSGRTCADVVYKSDVEKALDKAGVKYE